MALTHCISYVIYVRVLFIIRSVLCYTTDVLLKNACPNPNLDSFMEYSKPQCSYKIVAIKKIAPQNLQNTYFPARLYVCFTR